MILFWHALFFLLFSHPWRPDGLVLGNQPTKRPWTRSHDRRVFMGSHWKALGLNLQSDHLPIQWRHLWQGLVHNSVSKKCRFAGIPPSDIYQLGTPFMDSERYTFVTLIFKAIMLWDSSESLPRCYMAIVPRAILHGKPIEKIPRSYIVQYTDRVLHKRGLSLIQPDIKQSLQTK